MNYPSIYNPVIPAAAPTPKSPARRKPKPVRIYGVKIDHVNGCVKVEVSRPSSWGGDIDDTVVHYWSGNGTYKDIEEAITWAIKEAADMSP